MKESWCLLMKNYKSVEPFNEPSSILNRIDSSSQKTEMYDSERGFLCGLLREHQPKKIVEVGVAEGGTTAVILECVRELKLDCVMYSVDAAENLYYDKTKKTGYILDVLRGGIFPAASILSSPGKYSQRYWRKSEQTLIF